MNAESELLTRVGPGTPMGNLMREYWIPMAKSSELVADGAPVRLVLLGEKLIAFRDTSGRVGLMDHRCPHRCASLFFGRNEEDGLRCVYHGWKFDVEGKCLDMPNVPAHQQFTEQVHAKAYKAVERGGMVWAYMGARATPPALPEFEAALLPEDELVIQFVQRDCNWLQALEGDIDTSHLSFLHLGKDKAENLPEDRISRYNLIDRAPEYHVADTDWGTMYAAYRPANPGNTYWRVAHFLFPFWAMPPINKFETYAVARGWVPMDDTHTMFVTMSWTKIFSAQRNPGGVAPTRGALQRFRYRPDTTDWYGRYRLADDPANDYSLDREAQRSASYTGIDGIHLQDQAVTESMGEITDHDWEHLAISDRMITRTRQRLAQASRDLAGAGIMPPGVDNPKVYHNARGGDFVAPSSVGWLEAYADEVRRAINPTGVLTWRNAAE